MLFEPIQESTMVPRTEADAELVRNIGENMIMQKIINRTDETLWIQHRPDKLVRLSECI
jgi:hypothetical protein